MDLDRKICLCNDITADEVVDFIKNHNTDSLDILIKDMEIGNKCESCLSNGFKDDGFSVTKLFNLVKKGEI